MPRTKKQVRKSRITSSADNYLKQLQKSIKENTVNLIFGVVILLVVVIGVISALTKNGKNLSPRNLTKIFQFGNKKEEPKPQQKNTYKVKEGDYLWTIAEEKYGSGYNAYDIAEANKIDNPDLVEVDQLLILPQVAPRAPTKGEAMTTSTKQAQMQTSEYIVKQGDSLWNIALTQYGDGYVWPRLAQLNNLANPDLIVPGQRLTLWKN